MKTRDCYAECILLRDSTILSEDNINIEFAIKENFAPRSTNILTLIYLVTLRTYRLFTGFVYIREKNYYL